MPRTRDWKDYIPGRGEAEVGLKLKGSYGGRGGAMRRNRSFSKRNYLRGIDKKDLQWSLLEGPVGFFDGANLSVSNTIADPPVRLAYWNPASAYLTQALSPPPFVGKQTSLRRLIVQSYLKCQAGLLAGAVPATQTATQAVSWDDYVGPTGNTGGGGAVGTETAIGGLALYWAWIYETYEESLVGSPPITSFATASEWIRNRRIFKFGIQPLSMFNPRSLNFDLKFPKGLNLSLGDKENWQVTLVGNPNFPTSGTGSGDTCTIMGMGRAQFVPAD